MLRCASGAGWARSCHATCTTSGCSPARRASHPPWTPPLPPPCSITPVRDASGRLLSFIGVQSDITELVRRRQAEKELQVPPGRLHTAHTHTRLLAVAHRIAASQPCPGGIFRDEAWTALALCRARCQRSMPPLPPSRLVQEAKVAAETAAEAKSMFLANMSHEIRTPLNGMIAVAQVALGRRAAGGGVGSAGKREPSLGIQDAAVHTARQAEGTLRHRAAAQPCRGHAGPELRPVLMPRAPPPAAPAAAAVQRADPRAARADRHHPGERQHPADHPGRHPGLLQGGLGVGACACVYLPRQMWGAPGAAGKHSRRGRPGDKGTLFRCRLRTLPSLLWPSPALRASSCACRVLNHAGTGAGPCTPPPPPHPRPPPRADRPQQHGAGVGPRGAARHGGGVHRDDGRRRLAQGAGRGLRHRPPAAGPPPHGRLHPHPPGGRSPLAPAPPRARLRLP